MIVQRTKRGTRNPFSSGTSSARWMVLRRGSQWNRAVRELTRGNAGVYAIREMANPRTVLYVGESHTPGGDPLRWWKTIVRHFYDASGKFSARNEWTYQGGHDLEVALWRTAPAGAVEQEGKLLLELEPLHNRIPFEAETDFDPATLENPRTRMPKATKPKKRSKKRKAQRAPSGARQKGSRVTIEKSTKVKTVRQNPKRNPARQVCITKPVKVRKRGHFLHRDSPSTHTLERGDILTVITSIGGHRLSGFGPTGDVVIARTARGEKVWLESDEYRLC